MTPQGDIHPTTPRAVSKGPWLPQDTVLDFVLVMTRALHASRQRDIARERDIGRQTPSFPSSRVCFLVCSFALPRGPEGDHDCMWQKIAQEGLLRFLNTTPVSYHFIIIRCSSVDYTRSAVASCGLLPQRRGTLDQDVRGENTPGDFLLRVLQHATVVVCGRINYLPVAWRCGRPTDGVALHAIRTGPFSPRLLLRCVGEDA